MATIFFRYLAVVFFATYLVLGSFVNESNAGLFSNTCVKLNYRQGTLRAICEGGIDPDRPSTTSINLNEIIANDNGELRWAPLGTFGNYKNTCNNEQLIQGPQPFLVAECLNRQNERNPSDLNLDEEITNYFGELFYDPELDD